MAKSTFELSSTVCHDEPSPTDQDQPESPHVSERYRGTAADRDEMQMLGRQQLLRRNFNRVSMLGFASMVMVAWEACVVVLQYPLTDGGTPVLFWGLIFGPIGMTFVYMSLAELASMSPTSGGQYHWVSELAPSRYQKQLSYLTGWLISLGWQTWLCGTCFMAANGLIELIALNNATYAPQGWHATLLVIGIVLFAVMVNTVFAQYMPIMQVMLMVLHIGGFLAVVIPLGIAGPRGDTQDIIFDVVDSGGWGSKGVSFMIGLSYIMGALYGYDCTAHMAEEVRDASTTIPAVMLWGMWSNAIMLLVVGMTLIFTMGDTQSVIQAETPFIQAFMNATDNRATTNAMTVIVVVALVAAIISEVATASRQLWSFARDQGLPFSGWLAIVTPGWDIPLHAVFVSVGFTSCLALIYLGSEEAFNAVNSLAEVALLSSYIVSISCVVWRRLYGPPLPAHRWSLGRAGLPVNIVALCFLSPIFCFSVWPVNQPVTVQSMNWASLIFVGVLIIAAAYYLLKARHTYVGPVVLVKRRE